MTFQYNKELASCSNIIEDLNQELLRERKMKESLLEENCELKNKIEDNQNKMKYTFIRKEEENSKFFEAKKFEIQEISKEKLKKDEDFQRISQVNIELHKNLQFLKQEKEDLLRKNREFEVKNKVFDEENSKMKKKNEENEKKMEEFKEKFNDKVKELNMIRNEQRSSMDASFKIEKENIMKYEEFHQVFLIFSIFSHFSTFFHIFSHFFTFFLIFSLFSHFFTFFLIFSHFFSFFHIFSHFFSFYCFSLRY